MSHRNVDLREYLSEEVQAAHTNTTYDLIANIVHDGKPSEGSYRIHVLHHVSVPCPCGVGGCVCDNWGDPPAVSPLSPSIPSQGTGKWYELQDLQVTDILPQMITLSEAYIQVRGFGDSEGGVPGDACHPPKLSPRPTLTPSSPLCHRSGSGARRTRRTNKAPEPLRDTRNLPWGCLFPPRGHPEPP